MDIVKVDDMPTNPNDKVTLKQTGNVFEVRITVQGYADDKA